MCRDTSPRNVPLSYLVKEELEATVPCKHGATGRKICRIGALITKLTEDDVVLTLTAKGGVTNGLFGNVFLIAYVSPYYRMDEKKYNEFSMRMLKQVQIFVLPMTIHQPLRTDHVSEKY